VTKGESSLALITGGIGLASASLFPRNEIKQLPYLEESIISRLAMTYLLITVVQLKEAKIC